MKNTSLIIRSLFFTFFWATTHAGYSLPPTPPSLDISINGLEVTASWTSVEGAIGYELFYAPCPQLDYIERVDMGNQTRFSVTLWEGAAFYVAIQAYNRDGNSEYSNIEHFGCGSNPLQSSTETVADEVPTVPPMCLETPQSMINLPTDEMFHLEPIEWWYWTGHLQTEKGRWFGFEQAVFLMRMMGRTMQMAHHAITDIEDGTFHYAVTTQFAAPSPPAAGFNWDVKGLTAKGGGGTDYLHGEVDNYVLDLKLVSQKPAVFQHEDGYTEYSFGGYTYYYSYPKMAAEGTLKIGDEELTVTGSGWFDHQWGDLTKVSSLGWDWFAIQLDDNREIMLANVNATDSDEGDVLVGGSYTDANCQVSQLHADEVEITPLGEWTSPHTQCIYPQGWQIRVGDLNLTVTPVMPDQEVVGYQTYWEGAAIVSGDASGRAYVELAGYCNK
jgi:predicted secreted hydrolase